MVWVALLQLTGCAASNSATNVANVEVGMTQAQVISILGQPRMRETYGGTEFLFYANDAGNNIPIAIVEGRVTSIGRAAYDVVVRSSAPSKASAAR
jgi:hypothetical protein